MSVVLLGRESEFSPGHQYRNPARLSRLVEGYHMVWCTSHEGWLTVVPSSMVRALAASRSRRGRAWAGWSRRGRAWAGSSGPGGWSCLLHRGYLVSLRADLWSRLLLYKSSSVTIQVDVHEQCRFADCTSKTDDNLQTLATEQRDGGYVVLHYYSKSQLYGGITS